MTSQVTLRLESYDKPARTHVAAAQSFADERGHAEVDPLHLLVELTSESDEVRAAIEKAGVDPDDVLIESELLLRKRANGNGRHAYLSPRMLDLLGRAEGEAARARGSRVQVSHLLLATSQTPEGPAWRVLRACGLSAPTLRAAIGAPDRSADSAASAGTAARPATEVGGELLGTDLTRQALQGKLDPVVGRDAELRRVLQVLARRRQNNPLLVGETGVGRRSVVHALAGRIARNDVPSMLEGKRIVTLSASQLLAGARLRGEAEDRIRDWLAAVRDSAGEVLVYSPDLATLVADRSSGMLGQLIADALLRSQLRLIGVTDPSGLQKLDSEARELRELLVPIDIEPPDVQETVAILRGVVPRYEIEHGLDITDPALVAAASLARRYIPSVQLPRAAIDLVDEAAARLRVEMESVPASLDQQQRRLQNVELQLLALSDDNDHDSTSTREKLQQERDTLLPAVQEQRTRLERQRGWLSEIRELKARSAAAEQEAAEAHDAGQPDRESELRFTVIPKLLADAEALHGELAADGEAMVRDSVTDVDVAAVVAELTGVPVMRMLEEEAKKLLRMEESLGRRVIGQPDAVGAISRAVRRGRVGLRDPGKPIGSFLFLGTSGVGKTELAKALAEFLFDDEHALTRLDMSEFMEKHTVARLLGAPPGYVDSQEGGFLTEAVRQRPYSVLLFDEIEKAHPDVFDILLQVLDDGRLTDSRGQLAHFADTVIVLTSNIGSELILERGASDPTLEDAMRDRLLESLRPEFLNRIDDTVVFRTLDRDDLGAILELELAKLQRLLSPKRITLQLTDPAKDALVELGHDPAFGARPLKRTLLRQLQDPLAEALLRGGYDPGTTLEVDVVDGEFVFVALS